MNSDKFTPLFTGFVSLVCLCAALFWAPYTMVNVCYLIFFLMFGKESIDSYQTPKKEFMKSLLSDPKNDDWEDDYI